MVFKGADARVEEKKSVENLGAEIAGFRIPNHIECDEAIVSHDFREDYKFLLKKKSGHDTLNEDFSGAYV